MTPQELKNSILQLAIQGKLVEQRPEEGTAEELYKQIQAEKKRLIKEDKIKKEKPLPEITEEEKPFDIPESWKWVRLDDVVIKAIKRGKSPAYAANSNTMVFAQKCNTKAGKIDLSLALFLDETKLAKYPESEFILNNDIVINSTGNGTLGRVGLYQDSDNLYNMPLVADSHVTVIRASESMCNGYLFYCLKYHQPYLERLGSGSTNQTELSATIVRTLPIPLPPLTEQKRIVAKIEELLPYIDRYEQAWSKLEDFNKRFPTDMQKSILQMAIQGKLVEQRSEEGTADELYKQIQAEKKRLIKEGKIKKEKPFSSNVAYKDLPFAIPKSWCFVRFGELMISRDSERIPVPSVDRLKRAKKYNYYGASGVIDKIDDYLFDKELLLIGEDGANLLSRSTPIAFLASGKYWVNNHAHVLDGCAGLNLNYICSYINTISLAPYVSGTAQPKMNQENMNAIWVALPPLAEQKRIVAKLEELLPLCEKLK